MSTTTYYNYCTHITSALSERTVMTSNCLLNKIKTHINCQRSVVGFISFCVLSLANFSSLFLFLYFPVIRSPIVNSNFSSCFFFLLLLNLMVFLFVFFIYLHCEELERTKQVQYVHDVSIKRSDYIGKAISQCALYCIAIAISVTLRHIFFSLSPCLSLNCLLLVLLLLLLLLLKYVVIVDFCN